MTDARAILPVLLLSLPLPALADLEFCNNTDENVSVAIGYSDDGTWVSEGWWTTAPGDCTTPVAGDLPNRYYYWRATSSSYSWENEQYMFCTSSKAFTIVGDENCEGRGYDRNPFNEIDLGGATSYTMNLTAGSSGSGVSDRDRPMTGDDDGASLDNTVAPGTHGEPYTVSGILSHCDYFDAGIGCTVLADGWSYFATSYDHTDPDLLVTLDGLGVNVPLTMSGDMISYDRTDAMVTIREWQRTGQDPFAATRAALQGYWTSTDDAAYEVLIHGSSFEEYYDQLPDLPLTMHFRDGCPGAPGNGPAFQLASIDRQEDRCVLVGQADRMRLEILVAGTMRPLQFRRTN